MDCILDNLCELKETRDVIDNNVHNSLMNCIHGKKSVCIFKLESFNEHDLAINVYSMNNIHYQCCLLYTSPSPRDQRGSRMPSSA